MKALFPTNLLYIVVAGLFLCSCGGQPPEGAGAGLPPGDGDPSAGQVICVGNGAEPQDIDPHVVTGVPEHRITSTLFEGLVGVNPATLEPVPAVAESWEVSEDGTVYTFHLRDTAKWTNGDPVTAHDFLYAWERILTPALGSQYAYMLYCMRNARAFNEGTITDFTEVGARALDDHTVEVTLEHPTPYFLSMQIHYTWFPVHQATIEKFGGMAERGTRWTREGNFVGNGPFMLDRWQPDEVLVVKKNPTYWDATNVRPDAVHFYPISNLQTEELLFRDGKLHLTESVPINKIDIYAKRNPELLCNDPYLGTYYYRLNVERPPFTDRRVRRAFSMAVDRDDLVRNVVRGGRKPAGCFTPPDTAGYTCEAQVPYDVEEARRLLAEAGYPNGEGLPPIEILYNKSENHKQIAEALQSMWLENLNAQVTLTNQDWKVYLDTLQQRNYQIARAGWIGDFVDPINFLECFTTDNGNNRTGFSSPEYDALIDQAMRTIDPAARNDLFQQAERLLLDESPLIPLYFYTRAYLKTPALRGLEPNPLGYISFKQLHLERN